MVPSAYQIVVLAILVQFAVHRVDAAGQPFDAGEKTEIVDRHNELRREQGANGMNYIDWDNALATQAQSLADSCVFEHANEGLVVGEFQTVGENIFAISGDSSEPKTGLDATNEWYSEHQDYDVNSHTCSAECGHYTQVVWAKTRRIGCGRAHCPTLRDSPVQDAWFIVCDYGPAGNVNDEAPFEIGDACTQCDSGSGQCDDGLCRPCSEHNEECVCRLECQNCGDLDQDACTCSCANGFRGADCSGICEDTDPMCGANPGWPDADACSLGPFVPLGCPLMCGECNGPDEDFVCEPGQTGGSGTSGTQTGGSGRKPKKPKKPKQTGGGSEGAGASGQSGDICNQVFSAATYVDDMLYLFHEGRLWRVSSSGDLQSPVEGEDAQERFIKLPDDISAVYQRQDGNVIFLRHEKMYIFNGRKRIEGHPIKVVEWGVDSVIQGAAHDRNRGKTYFFKGPRVWRYDEASKNVDSGYPKSIGEEFQDQLNKPKFVFSDSQGNYFFVKNQKVFRVSRGRKRVDSGYPKPFASEFFSDC